MISRRFVSRLGRLLTLAAAAFVLVKLFSLRDAVADAFLGLGAASTIQLFMFALIFALLLASKGMGWSWLLRRLVGEGQRLMDGLIVHGTTQVLKYLPGNVFHYAGRQFSAERYGWPQTSVAAASTCEALLNAASAAIVAAVSLAFIPASIAQENLSALIVVTPVSIILILVALNILGRLPAKTVRFAFAVRFKESVSRLLLSRAVIFPTVLYVLFFAISGGLLFATANLLGGMEKTPGFILFVGVFPVAWLAGFATPGAPGGLGIRETVLVLFLGPAIGDASALSTAIAYRAVTLLGELIYFALAFRLSSTRRR